MKQKSLLLIISTLISVLLKFGFEHPHSGKDARAVSHGSRGRQRHPGSNRALIGDVCAIRQITTTHLNRMSGIVKNSAASTKDNIVTDCLSFANYSRRTARIFGP